MKTTVAELRRSGKWDYFHVPALTDAGLIHGFFTRTSSPAATDPAERRALSEALSLSRTIIMDQVHGDDIHAVRSGEAPARGDGLLVMEGRVGAIIKTADCIPVILFDSISRVAAILHAGWKGTLAGIAAKAAALMVEEGATPERIEALIGPGIGPCCYKVKSDVANAFREGGFEAHLRPEGPESFLLDLKGVNRAVLAGAGVTKTLDLELCTSCRQDLFYSARRNGQAGRQINLAALA